MPTVAEERMQYFLPYLLRYFGETAMLAPPPAEYFVVPDYGPGELRLINAVFGGDPVKFTFEFGAGEVLRRETFEHCRVHVFIPADDDDRSAYLCITAHDRPSPPGAKQYRAAEKIYLIGQYSPRTRRGVFKRVQA